MESSALQLTLLKDYKPSAFEIPKVELEVFIEKNFTEVHAKLTVNKVNKTASRDMVLDGEDLELLEIKINDRILATSEYLWSDNSLILKSVEDSFILETTVRIYPEKNTQLMGLYASQHGYFTQCEAEGFRRITFFLDRPDIGDTIVV